jgi:uncharacterized iron-regulated membrane protein
VQTEESTPMATLNAVNPDTREPWLNYRTIWRWHFYAGLFCIPFVLWLAATGSIYLFRPQIEAWLDRPYEHLAISGARQSGEAQVAAALAAVPGSNLHYYQLPRGIRSAVQIVVGRKAEEYRAYVNPYTLQVLKIVNEDHRPMNVIFHLHGELFMGDRGSFIVETAASWAIVMILTGLYLWWPRRADGLGGVLYPRLRSGGRTFWRDIHAVTGMWVSFFALLFLFTGLPWAKSWSGYLRAARRVTGKSLVHEDWTTGRSSEIAERLAMNRGSVAALADLHAGHTAHMDMGTPPPGAYAAIDRLIAPVGRLHFAFPVLISPPMRRGGPWTAKSDSQDRVLRDQVALDPATGTVLARLNFSQRPLIDRVVGIGVAAHEGHLYGWLNQLVNLCTAIGLIVLSVSALVLWWRRRPEGVLGAPTPLTKPRFTFGLVALILALGVYLPLFGLSLCLVLLTERFALRRLPGARHWLGLSSSPAPSQG